MLPAIGNENENDNDNDNNKFNFKTIMIIQNNLRSSIICCLLSGGI